MIVGGFSVAGIRAPRYVRRNRGKKRPWSFTSHLPRYQAMTGWICELELTRSLFEF